MAEGSGGDLSGEALSLHCIGSVLRTIHAGMMGGAGRGARRDQKWHASVSRTIHVGGTARDGGLSCEDQKWRTGGAQMG